MLEQVLRQPDEVSRRAVALLLVVQLDELEQLAHRQLRALRREFAAVGLGLPLALAVLLPVDEERHVPEAALWMLEDAPVTADARRSVGHGQPRFCRSRYFRMPWLEKRSDRPTRFVNGSSFAWW